VDGKVFFRIPPAAGLGISVVENAYTRLGWLMEE
jgi:hypothetical protein